MAHPDGCEIIAWHQGTRRCELWTVSGKGELRIFDEATLIHRELLTDGKGYRVAETLRERFRGEPTPSDDDKG